MFLPDCYVFNPNTESKLELEKTSEFLIIIPLIQSGLEEVFTQFIEDCTQNFTASQNIIPDVYA